VGPAPLPAGAAPRPAAPPAPPTALAVYVRPYAQRALLDGVEVARDEQVVRVAVPHGGQHELRIEHGCCTPFVRSLTAEEAAAAGELRVPLAPRPARLRVDGDPALRVFLEDRLVGTAGDSQRSPFVIPIPEGGASPYEARSRIRLDLAGASSEVQVTLRAGESLTVAGPQAGAAPPPVPPTTVAAPQAGDEESP
jgi:serine/threonine-protein kinase